MLGSSRLLRAVSGCVLACAGLIGFAPDASAVTAACDYDSGTKVVTIGVPPTDNLTHTVSRDVAGAILADGVLCGAATVTNTDTIVVPNAGSGTQSFAIDETNGPFAPGATVEGTGLSEIEFQVSLGQGTDNLTITGTGQADSITLASATKARLNGDKDPDITLGDTESFTVFGQGGNDKIKVNLAFGGTYVYGGNGNDRLTGGVEVEALYGGLGKDVSIGGDGNDLIDAGPGNDTLSGGYGNDTILPDSGDDIVMGDGGRDTVESDNVADGADVISGGTGTDTADYQSRTSSVTVTLDDVADDGAPGEGDNIASDFENVNTGSGADTLTGNAADNFLDGRDGLDVINGGDGDDVLSDGNGNDFVFGGNGDDTLYTGQGDDFASGEGGADTIFTESVADGSDSFDGGSGIDTVSYSGRSADLTLVISGTNNGEAGEGDGFGSNIENIYGGAGNDTISGSLADNSLVGGSGNDTIDGGVGKDYLTGSGGNDTLFAGDGTDYVDAGVGDDTLHLTDGGADTGFCGDGTDNATDHDIFDSLVACEVT
jgi:Ca2+-binding RTX toxin-like protein